MRRYTPFYCFFLVLWLLLLVFPCVFWVKVVYTSSDYSEFFNFVKHQFENSFYSNHLEKFFLSESYFLVVKNSIWWVVTLISVLLILALYSLGFFYKKKEESRGESLRGRYKLTPVVLLLLSWLGYKLFLYSYLPLHIDEVFDFVYYTRHDFLTRHSYQFTNGIEWFNSHVLYTDISACFLKLGFSDKASIRLPSIIAEFLLLFTIFRIAKNDDKIKPIFVVLVVMFSFWQSLYSVEGRSYLFASLFCVLSFRAIIDFEKNNTVSDLLLYVIVVVLGVASNKLFVLPFIGSVIYMLVRWNKWEPRQKTMLIMALVLVCVLILLFYMPILLLSGVKNIIPFGGGQFGHSLFYKFPLLIESISVITNINSKSYLVIPLVIGGCVVLRRQFSKQTLEIQIYFTIQILVYGFYTLLSGDYLPFRTLIYLNTLFSIVLAFSMFDLLKRAKRGAIIGLALSIFFIWGNLVYNFKYGWVNKLSMFITGNEFYSSLDKQVDEIGELNPDKILIHHNLHFLLFYSQLKFPNQTSAYEETPSLGENNVIISPVKLDLDTIFLMYNSQDIFIYFNH